MRALKRHPLLRLDLQEAYDWYEDRCPGLGTEFESDFKKHIQALSQDAPLYAVRFAAVRRLNLDRFPYGLFYVIREPGIWVLGLLHGSRDHETILAERRRHFHG